MNISLFQLDELAEALRQLLETEPDDAVVQAALDAVLEQTASKIDGYCSLIRVFEADAAVCEAEMVRRKALREARLGKARRLRDALMQRMEQRGETLIQGHTCSARVQNNGGLAPLVIDPELHDQPGLAGTAYVRTRLELDLPAIRAALAEGIPVNGCALGERGRRLVLK